MIQAWIPCQTCQWALVQDHNSPMDQQTWIPSTWMTCARVGRQKYFYSALREVVIRSGGKVRGGFSKNHFKFLPYTKIPPCLPPHPEQICERHLQHMWSAKSKSATSFTSRSRDTAFASKVPSTWTTAATATKALMNCKISLIVMLRPYCAPTFYCCKQY